MIRILFVVGMSRSGSTLLTALLNRAHGFVGLGETHVFWEIAGGERLCGCGETLAACPVWGTLYRRQEEREVDIAEMRSSFRAFVRPRPSALLRGLRAQRGGSGATRLERYLTTMEATYLWLAERTGSTVLVDASKLPTAAALTEAMTTTDVRLLHLVRDPRAVAHSLARQRREAAGRFGSLHYLLAAARAAADWTLRNAYAEARLRRLFTRRYRRLRFEDLVREPRATVAELLEFARADSASDVFASADSVELGENHILTGDAVRFKRGTVKIAPNEAWRVAMPAPARALTTALTLPLLVLYGYPLLPRSRRFR